MMSECSTVQPLPRTYTMTKTAQISPL